MLPAGIQERRAVARVEAMHSRWDWFWGFFAGLFLFGSGLLTGLTVAVTWWVCHE